MAFEEIFSTLLEVLLEAGYDSSTVRREQEIQRLKEEYNQYVVSEHPVGLEPIKPQDHQNYTP